MIIATLRSLIRTTLQPIELYSVNAEELLVATCAQESALGTYRQQIDGPALGIFQMEPATWDDAWRNYLLYHPALYTWMDSLRKLPVLAEREMITNDALAIGMARIQYYRAAEPLPPATDLWGLWSLYKKRWNTPMGAATWGQFKANYAKYVTDGEAK
jgi:hypothetical protein